MPRFAPDQMLFDAILAPPGPARPGSPSGPAPAPPFVAMLSAELVALDRIVRNAADRPFLAAAIRLADARSGTAAELGFRAATDGLKRAAPRLGGAMVSAIWSVLARRVTTLRPGLAVTIEVSAARALRLTAVEGVIADIGGIDVPPPEMAWNFAAATIPVYAAHADRGDGTLGQWQQWLQVAQAWRFGGPELDAVIGLLTPPPPAEAAA